MDDVNYCREHLLANLGRGVLAYRYPMIVLEPEISADGSYVPFLNFWENEDVKNMVGKAESAIIDSLLNAVHSHKCERCEKRARALYLPNTIFRNKTAPDFVNIDNYPKSYFCGNHIWNKLAEIVNETTHFYGEQGDVGINAGTGHFGSA